MNPYGITPKNFDENRLNQFISSQIIEGRQLDYKQCLPFNNLEDKKEFLADICSFANTSGGLILYGISEGQDNKGKNTGLPEAIVGVGEINLDQESLRLGNLLRDGISPRIIGLQIQSLKLSSGLNILAVFIPRSWNGPHAVTLSGSMRFYSRNNSGKNQMDIGELKSAFLNQNNLEELLRGFTSDRKGRIIRDDLVPAPLRKGPKIIAHILPLDQSQSIDLISLQHDRPSLKLIYLAGIGLCRFNLDGLIFYNILREGKVDSYTQIFRNGNVEGVTSQLIDENHENLPYEVIEDKIINFFDHYRLVLQKYEISFPYLFSVSITGVKGKRILGPKPSHVTDPNNYTIDRQHLALPEVLVDSVEVKTEISLRPILDTLWQAAGWPKSISYNDYGEWVRNKKPKK